MEAPLPSSPAAGPPSGREDPPGATRVSTLELFFDLVFVFTITQLTGVVDHQPGLAAVGQAALILVILFWMYGGFAWLTNASGTGSAGPRITVLAGMAALLICSMAVPEAFGASGIAFGIAYLVLTLIHAVGFRLFGDEAGRRGILRLGPINVLGAVLILLAGWQQGWWDWALWGFVAAMYLSALIYFGGSENFRLQPGHFAERHGLMIIIALGESVVSVALAATGQEIDLRLVVGALCGFAAIAGLWWVYFVGDDEAATEAVVAAGPALPASRTGLGYDLTHLLMIAGIIGVAAGTRLGLADLLVPASTAGGVLIAAGTSLYLLGSAWFRTAFHFASHTSRLVAAGLVLLAWPVAVTWGTAQALAVVAVILAGTAWLDSRRDGQPDLDRATARTDTKERA